MSARGQSPHSSTPAGTEAWGKNEKVVSKLQVGSAQVWGCAEESTAKEKQCQERQPLKSGECQEGNQQCTPQEVRVTASTRARGQSSCRCVRWALESSLQRVRTGGVTRVESWLKASPSRLCLGPLTRCSDSLNGRRLLHPLRGATALATIVSPRRHPSRTVGVVWWRATRRVDCACMGQTHHRARSRSRAVARMN